MIEVEITREQIKRAKSLYDFKVLANSIMKGKSNKYGAIGEILAYDYFCKTKEVVFESTFDYDMIVDGSTIDIKTKRTTVRPEPHFNCSISKHSTHQRCDYLFFVRVMEDMSKAWLLGQISRDDFYKKATFNAKGEKDGNWTFKSDCYNLQIKDI